MCFIVCWIFAFRKKSGGKGSGGCGGDGGEVEGLLGVVDGGNSRRYWRIWIIQMLYARKFRISLLSGLWMKFITCSPLTIRPAHTPAKHHQTSPPQNTCHKSTTNLASFQSLPHQSPANSPILTNYVAPEINAMCTCDTQPNPKTTIQTLALWR
jgi:hypothetical protein